MVGNRRRLQAEQLNRADLQVAVLGASVATLLVGGAIWYGYSTFLASWKPQAPTFGHVFGGLICLLVALVLAWATAHSRNVARERDEGASKFAGAGWFVPLLVISALGAMNTLFYLLESDDVVKQRLDNTREALAALRLEGTKALRVPTIEDKRRTVESLLRNLQQRIEEGKGTPNSCGIGADAQQEFSELQKLFPYFRPAPMSPFTSCLDKSRLALIYKAQADAVWKQFDADAEYVKQRGKERDSLLAELDRKVIEMGTQIGSDSSSLRRDVQESKVALQQVSAVFADLRAKIEVLTGVKLSDVPKSLDIDDVQTLGNPGHVVKNLFKRWYHFQTLLIVAIAVAADAWLVRAYRILQSQLLVRPVPVRASSRPAAATEVHYLWDRRGG